MEELDTGEARSIRLLADVAEDNFQALIQAGVVQRFAPRASLAQEGEHTDFLHILLEGSVELFAQEDGQETTITVLTPISAFILPAIVGDLPCLASARTLRPSRILMVRADAVRTAFETDPVFARAIICELSREFRRLLTEVKNQKLRTSTERLADWLLRANAQLGEAGRFTLPLDKRTLASRLGMTPENLSRNLKALSDRGVVVNGRDVILEDLAGLAGIARYETGADEADL
jgi:CRP/FNR family transcriptional regulator, transcriptional activator FtrB